MKAQHTLWLFVLICYLFPFDGLAQLSITTGATATQYAQDIVGSGVTVSNVNLDINNNNQIGTFSNGSSTNIGLDNGVILSSGNVGSASGSASSSASTNYTSTGCGLFGLSPCPSNAPDLTAVSGQDIYDAAILEFDFVPSGPTISFQFVFGSDEYPSYVNSVNDAFGIFLSGPGISGSYSNSGVNIATVPSTSTPISINNVNDGYSGVCTNPGPSCTNCTYYVNNCGGTTIQFNGFTTIITATYAVQCGQTYHIKFAVGDATDGILDSGVFIKAQSLESGIEITPNPVAICKGDATSLTATVVGASGGSYSWLPGGQTTSSISVSPTTTTDYIATYTENGCSISDTVTVTVNNCGCTAPDEIVNDLSFCSGNTIDLNTAIDPSSDPAILTFYSSQNDANNASNAISNTVSIGGSYWVRAENTTDPTCFNVYEIVVNKTTVTYTVDSQTNPACGNTNGSLELSANGGSIPYTFSIDNGANTQANGSFTNLAAGNYTVLITDDNGCQVTGNETITQQNAPIIDNINPSNPSCFGVCDGQIQATVSGGETPYTFSWTDVNANSVGTNASSISGLCEGSYNLEVTDNNNCVVTQNNITLTEPSQIVANFDIANHCAGENTPADNIATSGGIFSFSPDLGDGATISPTTGVISNGVGGTTYTIEYLVTMNGCTASSTNDVTVFALPNYSAAITNPSCGNVDGEINLTTTAGNAPFTFSIDNGTSTQTNGSFTNLAAGNYDILITDNNGCQVAGNETITQSSQPSIISITPANPSCFGVCDGTGTVVVSGGSTPYTYSWTDANNVSVGTTNQVSGLCSGNYTVEITDSNGCSISGTATLTEPAQIDPSFSLTDFCADEMNVASGIVTPGGLFSFNPPPGDGATINGASGSITNGVEGTTYTVQYEAQVGGCTATSTQNVTVNPIPSPDLEGETLDGCVPHSILFKNLTSFTGISDSCIWNFGDGTVSNSCNSTVAHTYISAGTYNVSLTVVSDKGCEGSILKSNYVDVHPRPTADFTANTMVVPTTDPTVYFNNQSIGASDYIWIFEDDSSKATSTNVSHKFNTDKSGNYNVTLVAMNGSLSCSDTLNMVIQVKEQVIFYVPNSFTPDNDNFNETFQPIFTSGYDPYSYTLLIYNRWGELLFESHNVNIGWDGTYGGKIVQDGSYVWKITFKEPKSMSDKHYTKIGHVNIIR